MSKIKIVTSNILTYREVNQVSNSAKFRRGLIVSGHRASQEIKVYLPPLSPANINLKLQYYLKVPRTAQGRTHQKILRLRIV